jgi:NAD+ kinase
MSAGGPIVMPDTNTFVITPIAPHNLTIRPLVISDKMTLTLNVESRDENFLISLDSRCEVVNNTIEMEICKANFCLNVLKLDNHEYFQVLRNKLMWGQDKRN